MDYVKKQIEFINNSDIFRILTFIKTDFLFEEMFSKLKIFVKNSNNTKISIVSFYEIFLFQSHIDKIVEFMESQNKEFYLSAPTSTKLDNFFEPLVNIYFWKSRIIGSDVSWVSYLNNSGIFLFKKNRYEIFQPKNNKGILSIRKKTKKRDYLNSIFDVNSFEGIYRYIEYPQQYGRELKTDTINQYPSMEDLINEYKKTFISFVVETDLIESPKFIPSKMNMLTEKTLIAFLTKTIPIVLGGKNYVKELKEMGLYVWNDEFGFANGDSLQNSDYNKINLFNECINTYNKITKEDIEKIYNNNLDKIQNNYNIVSNILFGKSTLI
jgi:hypothetical protein